MFSMVWRAEPNYVEAEPVGTVKRTEKRTLRLTVFYFVPSVGLMRTSLVISVLLTAVVAPAMAQRGAVEVAYGRWWHGAGGAAESYRATLYRPIGSIAEYGLGVTHLKDDQATEDRTQTGAEFSLMVDPPLTSLYVVGSVGAAMRHTNSDLDLSWSAGVGYVVSPLPIFRFRVEARYRLEDRNGSGFWAVDSTNRRGLSLSAGLAIPLGGSAGPESASPPVRGPVAPTPVPLSPVANPPDTQPVSGPAPLPTPRPDTDAAATLDNVVHTALEVMGAPYQWGGTDANGFDCSGLIQYAYQRHGVILPRISRDQIRTGTFVDPSVDALRPGDILGFVVDGSAVSHVGMYVGNGEFIHSSSQGVRKSSLLATDGTSQWWQRRWVSARRILE